MCCDFFGLIWFVTALFIWWLIYWIRLWTFKDDLIANAIFLKIFWHLKVTQPFMRFRVNQVYMLLSQSNKFISSPRWIFIFSLVAFLISLVKNLLLGLNPEKFWKFGVKIPRWVKHSLPGHWDRVFLIFLVI